MTTSSNKPKSWEIWLAYVRFSDHPEIGKVRPIVIIDHNSAAIIAAKITTKLQNHFEYVELADWEDEGLKLPSRVQIAPLFEVPISDLLNDAPLGVLSIRDRTSLGEALATNCKE